MDDKSRLQKFLRRWRKSPILFIRDNWDLEPQPLLPEFEEIASVAELRDYKGEWFGDFKDGKHITWQQYVILLAIERALKGDAPRRISVRSGHGIGKSVVLSWIIIWYLTTQFESQIACTAPSASQMHDVLWSAISGWIRKMPKIFQGLFDVQSSYIRVLESPKVWFARAATARKENPEALAGMRGKHTALVVDEASGVHNAIFRSAESILTQADVFFIMIGNPIRLEGYFYDSHHSDSGNWQVLGFNSEDSPIVDWKFVERIEQKYGKSSDEYRVRVQGEFPNEEGMDSSGYVPLLTEGKIRIVDKQVAFSEPKRMGIDPSGEGKDKTAWSIRDNFRGRTVRVEQTSTAKGIASKTLTLLDYYDIESEFIYIDNLGSGANVGVELALTQRSTNPVSFADRPDDERFLNKRAEMYWRLREWVIAGGEINGERLKEELLQIRYKITTSGKIQIMSKLEMRRQGIQSPDEADALALTFYEDDMEYDVIETREERARRRRRERLEHEDFNPSAVI